MTDMEDFIQWVPAGDDVGKVATHTSFMDVNFRPCAANPAITFPRRIRALPGISWWEQRRKVPTVRAEEIAHSYRSPARIDIHKDPGEPDEPHRGRVLLEGYDFALRAYVIRKTG